MRTISKILIVGILLTVFLSNCKKASNTSEIPYVRVYFRITLADPQFNKLNAPGGFVYVTGGSRGIILYRASLDEIVALDRHCTYRVGDYCRVAVNASQVVAADSCCGSEFVLTDGSVIKGPAGYSLQRYQAVFDGSGVTVSN